MSRPAKTIVPASAGSAPAIAFRSVLLPDPLGPMRPWKVPSSTTTSTPSSARSEPKLFVTWRTSSSGIASAPVAARTAAEAKGADALAIGDEEADDAGLLEDDDGEKDEAEDHWP